MLTRDVIIACDFASAEATFAFLDKFEQEPRKPFLKIGMELYYISWAFRSYPLMASPENG